MVAAFSLTILLFASVIAAKQPNNDQFAKLPINRQYHLVEHDRSRTETINLGTKFLQSRDGINSLTEYDIVHSNTATVGVGVPPKNYTLQVSTLSWITWVTAQSYVITNTSHRTFNNMSVLSNGYIFNATEFTDQVTIAPGLVVVNQSIGVFSYSESALPDHPINFPGDGILGIGPVNLTQGLLRENLSPVPTVADNLFSTHVIQKNLFSLFLTPLTNTSWEQTTSSSSNGEITWGGFNNESIVGSITYIPMIIENPLLWGINMSMNYDTIPIISNSTGVIDTDTIFIHLDNDIFSVYQNSTGAVYDNITQYFSITPNQYRNLQNLSFSVSDDVVFNLIPNAQIWPRFLNTHIGGVQAKIYLVIGLLETYKSNIPILNSFRGSFILGTAFLERFYSIYDTGNRRVGLAETAFTYANSN